MERGEHDDDEGEGVAVGAAGVEPRELALPRGIGVEAIQHVHEIVVNHALWEAALLARKRQAARLEVVNHRAPEGAIRERAERPIAGGQLAVSVKAQEEDRHREQGPRTLFLPHAGEEAAGVEGTGA